MTLATDLIAAFAATFRADAQDLLTTVKDLIRAVDAAPDDLPTQDAVDATLDLIKREAQERIDFGDEPDPMLRDVLACIGEFYN